MSNSKSYMTEHSPPLLGIDIGRVIIGAADASGKADASFLIGSDEAALSAPASEGASSRSRLF